MYYINILVQIPLILMLSINQRSSTQATFMVNKYLQAVIQHIIFIDFHHQWRIV
jgi:hypothetical protein